MFSFPKKERDIDFHYNLNFLNSVIFQIKYPDINNFSIDEEKFQNTFNEDFTIIRKTHERQVQLKIEKTPVLLTNEGPGGYECRSPGNKRIFSITNSTINYTITGDEYKNFNEAYNKFDGYIQYLKETIDISSLTRIAIRKINMYEFSTTKESTINFLLTLFNENLINSLALMPGNNNINSGLISVDYYETPYSLKILCGLLKRELKKEDETRRFATLDIDLFNRDSTVPLDKLPDTMKTINDAIFNIFEYYISDDLRNIMTQGKTK